VSWIILPALWDIEFADVDQALAEPVLQRLIHM